MIFQRLIMWLQKLFRLQPEETEREHEQKQKLRCSCEDTRTLNPTAIIANKLAHIVCAGATIEVIGGFHEDEDTGSGIKYTKPIRNARSEYLNTSLARVTGRLRQLVSRMLGVGGVVLKPSLINGELHTDAIMQDRFIVIEQKGEVIRKAGFVAAEFQVEQDIYTRMEYHSLADDGVYTIETIALKNDIQIPLPEVPKWANIEPTIKINGVEQMLFGVLKCPTDNQKDLNSPFGVPVTFGQDELIQMILDVYHEIPDEYKNKKAFVGASDLMFDENDRLLKTELYKMLHTDSEEFWRIFSPEIRHSAYFEGIDYLLGLLEKAVSVSKGILTDMDTANATAAEIRRSSFDTRATVDSVRDKVEIALNQLVYAFNVYTNALGLAPMGEYEINYDWSYALLEDTAETFEQLKGGQAMGDVNTKRRQPSIR